MDRQTNINRFIKIDLFMQKVFMNVFRKHKIVSSLISIVIYAAIMLISAKSLAVSANYFALFPAAVVSLAFGLIGGVFAGLLALPANLLMFEIIGHPEFSPASKPIAELAGITVGVFFGYFCDYFERFERELSARKEIEQELRNTVEQKEVLLREVNHRIMNNLNIVKSLINLQKSRTADPEHKEEYSQLALRVFAISMIYQQLHDSSLSLKGPRHYLEMLIDNIVKGTGTEHIDISLNVDMKDVCLPMTQMTIIGLIINEVISNSIKHAFKNVEDPKISVCLFAEGMEVKLRISDNGPGFDADALSSSGLGMKILHALAKDLKGEMSFRKENGSVFKLIFCPESVMPGSLS